MDILGFLADLFWPSNIHECILLGWSVAGMIWPLRQRLDANWASQRARSLKWVIFFGWIMAYALVNVIVLTPLTEVAILLVDPSVQIDTNWGETPPAESPAVEFVMPE